VGQRRGEKKKHLRQGGCSSAKQAEQAHPQLVHWWLLVHSSRGIWVYCFENNFVHVQVSTHSPVNYPVLQVANQVAQGKLKAGAAIVRPPRHHAKADARMGFCLFNNVDTCTLRIIWSIDIWFVAPCIIEGVEPGIVLFLM
jgi:hypothetical protein